MKRFDSYVNQKAISDLGPEPKFEYVFHAYKSGTAATFQTKSDAEAIKPEHITRDVSHESKEAHRIYWAARAEIEGCASQAFHKDLRAEYVRFNDATYAVLYDEAYDRGHSSGYDYVAECLDSLAWLADEIIKANKS